MLLKLEKSKFSSIGLAEIYFPFSNWKLFGKYPWEVSSSVMLKARLTLSSDKVVQGFVQTNENENIGGKVFCDFSG